VYSNAEAGSCTDCPFGRYSDGSQNTDCTDCQVGRYYTSTGASVCTNCPCGRFTNSLGTVTGTQCPQGRYQSSTQSTDCVDCPTGTYCPSLEMCTPTPCPAGYHGNQEARSTSVCTRQCYDRELCPEGSVNPLDCPAGEWCRIGFSHGVCYLASHCPPASRESTTLHMLSDSRVASTAASDGFRTALGATPIGALVVDVVAPLDGSTSWTESLVLNEAEDGTEQLGIAIPPLSQDLASQLAHEEVMHVRNAVSEAQDWCFPRARRTSMG